MPGRRTLKRLLLHRLSVWWPAIRNGFCGVGITVSFFVVIGRLTQTVWWFAGFAGLVVFIFSRWSYDEIL